MKEEDYKKLRCCGPDPENTGIKKVYGYCSEEKIKYFCSGSECAAWIPEKKYHTGFPFSSNSLNLTSLYVTKQRSSGF